MSITMKNDLQFLCREPDRHGSERIYARPNGKRIRIREQEDTPGIVKAHAAVVESPKISAI